MGSFWSSEEPYMPAPPPRQLNEQDFTRMERTVMASAAARVTMQEGEVLLKSLTSAAKRIAQSDGAFLSNAAKAELCGIMDAMRPEHLGLELPARSNSAPKAPLIVRTQIVWASEEFEIDIFLFPDGASLPLHDHPNMTVLSKVLYGRLGVRSYDWETQPTAAEYTAFEAELERQESPDPARRAAAPLVPPRAAYRRPDALLTSDAATTSLNPMEANVHAFVAHGATAVIDLLLPPYNDDAGRDCHYFDDGDSAGASSGAQSPVMLRAAAPPDTLIIKGAPFLGPRV